MPRSHPASNAHCTRVVLRSPTIDDRTEYVALRRRSRALLFPWEPHTPHGGLPAPAKVFERLLLTANTETSVRFLIIERASGRIAGQVSINQIFRGPFNNALLGYWLGEGWTGKGYMTEALALAVEHAFGTLKLHRVEANIVPSNTPSIALVKRLGFRNEGVAKRYLQIAGRYQDHVHWALTSEEWPTPGAKAVLGGQRAGKRAGQKAGRSPRERPRTN